ncbi:circularly permuted type 2 ATP-grasp protein [Stappia stellulata]|uniref:circularly permuted type 2 ATP-grasp protein n=1 Tax=Stappia stellulata TaxID=71235 RepID=UPI00049042F4|nr:circularly permuted type 2 ATP-grasp protein [Stappia stellulata]
MTDTEPFNEMLGSDGEPRAPYKALADWFSGMTPAEMRRKSREAETIFRRLGITFAVYGTSEATERLIPFDIVPRVLAAAEWRRISAGIDQRVRALNAFLHDIYHRQEIIRAGRIPADLVVQNEAFLPEMIGFTPPRKVYAHIIGTDLVRVGEDEFYVLEDNTRTPSGVSYMLENRETMMRMFPELFQQNRVAPIEHYPDLLRETLESVAPETCDAQDPTVCILTPGIYNSAYFEHAFLADSMGVELCEARDLFVEDGKVFMRTTRAPERVHVIYRRIDDAFLDPLTFRPDSMLGVPGLFDAYRAGNVTICNAPGTGIADDKAVYAYLPEIIEFYTGQKPILQNVPTWNCARDDDLAYVLDHLSDIVVKEVHGSGGYGMLIGPTASKRELAEFKRRLKANPSNYIAQPTLSLSACPTHVASGLAPRHVDLRPYVLVGDKVRITPGGLTRVALKKGSLVVNSSQGGGTKDTWVLED